MKIRLKISKAILLFVMLFCVMVIFGFVSINASAMECSEDNQEASQETISHTHIFAYKRISNTQHQLMCLCGKTTGEKRNHIINASDTGKRYAKCIECNDLLDMATDMAFVIDADIEPVPPHEHDFSYKRIDSKHHQLKCDCGVVTGEIRNHIINASDTGNRYVKCIECSDLLDMTTDMAFVIGLDIEPEEPHTHKYTYSPVNNRQHKGYCDCGATVTGSHKFTQIAEGQKCLQCNYVVKFQISID